jgi:hypothetical protein
MYLTARGRVVLETLILGYAVRKIAVFIQPDRILQ